MTYSRVASTFFMTTILLHRKKFGSTLLSYILASFFFEVSYSLVYWNGFTNNLLGCFPYECRRVQIVHTSSEILCVEVYLLILLMWLPTWHNPFTQWCWDMRTTLHLREVFNCGFLEWEFQRLKHFLH